MKKRKKENYVPIEEYFKVCNVSDLGGNNLTYFNIAKELEKLTEEMELPWEVLVEKNCIYFSAKIDGFFFHLKYDKEGWKVVMAGVWKRAATLKDGIAFCLEQNLKLQKKTNFIKEKKYMDDIN